MAHASPAARLAGSIAGVFRETSEYQTPSDRIAASPEHALGMPPISWRVGAPVRVGESE